MRMAKDGTNRGGARAGAGRKKKALADKINEGKTAKVTVLPTANLKGIEMPAPNITPHVCRHTYCSNMARSGMRREASPFRETPKRSSTSWGTAKSA